MSTIKTLEKARETVYKIKGNGKQPDENKKAKAITLITEAIADLTPTPPYRPMASWLKNGATRGGYPETSLSLGGWSRSVRNDYLRERLAAGDTHIPFYVRTMQWPPIFEGKQPTFDLYSTPTRMHTILTEIENLGMVPLPILMDNVDHSAWIIRHQRIVRGLRDWGDRLDGRHVLLGLELEKTMDWGEVLPEVYVQDALANEDDGKPLGLAVMFPRLLWGVHWMSFPIRYVPSAYWHADQGDWDSHSQFKSKIADRMNLVRAKQAGKQVWWFEYAQHKDATVFDAERMRSWFLELAKDDEGIGC